MNMGHQIRLYYEQHLKDLEDPYLNATYIVDIGH